MTLKLACEALPDAPHGSGMYSSEADEYLISRLVAKDPVAQRRAFVMLAPLVRRVLRRTFGPAQEQEDLLQEVFLRLFNRIDTLRNPEALRAFAVSITVRACHAHFKRKRTRSFVRLWANEEAPEPAVHADTSASQALIHFYGILDHLEAQIRIAFVLRFIEGMTETEVAAALGVSFATGRRRIREAWRRVTILATNDPFLAEYVDHARASKPRLP